MQSFQVPFICSECKRDFVLSNNVVKKVSVFMEKECIDLTYFDCECGKRYFFQVDNDETKAILRKIVTIMAKIHDAKTEGKGVKRKYSVKYKVLSGQLKKARFDLMKKYEGKLYFDPWLKANVEIHFSL